MLVLSRELGQEIVVNENIRISVVEIRAGKVKLGIDAPADIPVHRAEVHEAIQREGKRK